MDNNILRNLTYGMYVVCANKGQAINGQISNTVFQITSEPVTISVSINKQNFTHGFIQSSRRFSAAVLAEDTPLEFIGRFGFKSGRDADKFKGINFKLLSSGCPVVLDNATGYLEVEVKKEFDCGTHTLFLAQMLGGEIFTTARPMTYAYYHQIKRGITPQAAPTFIKEEILPQTEAALAKYQCTVCGYIYDPAFGDRERQILAGTPFEKLPQDWVCPVCGATKDKFNKLV